MSYKWATCPSLDCVFSLSLSSSASAPVLLCPVLSLECLRTKCKVQSDPVSRLSCIPYLAPNLRGPHARSSVYGTRPPTLSFSHSRTPTTLPILTLPTKKAHAPSHAARSRLSLLPLALRWRRRGPGFAPLEHLHLLLGEPPLAALACPALPPLALDLWFANWVSFRSRTRLYEMGNAKSVTKEQNKKEINETENELNINEENYDINVKIS